MVNKRKVSSSILNAIGRNKKTEKPSTKYGKWRLFVGDTVQVVDGFKCLGQKGEIVRIDKIKKRCIVQGVNTVIRRQVGQGQGGTFEKALPIHYSNLALYEPEVDGPIKTCWRFNEAGKHVRISKVTGKPMPVPQPYLKKPEPGPAGPKDSFMNEVQDATYKPIQMTFEKYMQKAQMARRQASVGGRVDKTILHASRRNYF